MRCQAEVEEGCHITEMTNLYWICVGGHSYYQTEFVGYFVRNPP